MTDDRLDHHVLWHCAPLASSEYASLVHLADTSSLRGVVALPLEGVPCRIDYEVVVDKRWLPRFAAVTVTTPTRIATIDVRSSAAGRWELDGTAAPHLGGCSDLDLGWTPATNTIPIRRLDLEIGETAAVTAAWLRFPELDVVANDQQYTRLAADRWRYDSGDYSFELVTDVSSGLVLEYGDELWRAVATSRT